MEIEPPLPFEKRTNLKLPLVSARVEAGFPSPADDYMERGVDLNEELIRNPAATFFVRVQGNSMRDAGIQSGDVLIVDKSITPADRQIVVAMLNGEFTVKRLRRMDGRCFLEAANKSFIPIQIGEGDEMVIWGTVTYVIHKAK